METNTSSFKTRFNDNVAELTAIPFDVQACPISPHPILQTSSYIMCLLRWLIPGRQTNNIEDAENVKTKVVGIERYVQPQDTYKHQETERLVTGAWPAEE